MLLLLLLITIIIIMINHYYIWVGLEAFLFTWVSPRLLVKTVCYSAWGVASCTGTTQRRQIKDHPTGPPSHQPARLHRSTPCSPRAPGGAGFCTATRCTVPIARTFPCAEPLNYFCGIPSTFQALMINTLWDLLYLSMGSPLFVKGCSPLVERPRPSVEAQTRFVTPRISST